MIYRIVMQVSSAPAASGGESFGQHADNFIEFFAREISKWIGAAYHFKQSILSPFLRRDRGHNLLGQNVERSDGNDDRVKPPGSNRPETGR